ncbi:MAG: serine hydroxymethyltransferase [Patescibacteria group bacterium]
MKDPQIKKLIEQEKKRQKKVINLIASENYASKDVLAALGSELTNKYAEGYAGKRYYGGNEIVDKIENLCKERALKLFGLSPQKWHVNVQPLSGSPANLAVYLALLGGADFTKNHIEPKKIMGMSLDHGGHLTHGHKVSASGKFWTQISYGVDKKTEQLDYDEIKRIALREKPDIIVAGYTAYSRKIDWKKFKIIADVCGAYLMADISHIAGLVAAGEHLSPFLYCDVVTSTTHKTLRGPRAALIFSKIDSREIYKKIDKAVFPGLQGGPHLNNIASVAIALAEANQPSFKKYIKQVVRNAKAMSEEFKKLGWRVISGGTDTHLFLLDTMSRGISGKQASELLEQNGIIVNKNAIPFDSRPPMDPSGIRIGAPAETTRGRKEKDFIRIARKIDGILRAEVGNI